MKKAHKTFNSYNGTITKDHLRDATTVDFYEANNISETNTKPKLDKSPPQLTISVCADVLASWKFFSGAEPLSVAEHSCKHARAYIATLLSITMLI